MQSGGPIPVGDIERCQEHYDELVKNAQKWYFHIPL